MRPLFSALVAAGMLTSQYAAAQCVRPAEYAGLDVAGLKSQLMVTALTCSAEDKYNAFIAKFRSELLSDEKAAGSFFSRAYGRNSRSRQDAFITQLANNRSESGLQHGNLFCQRNIGIFDEVMSLRNGSELEQYAAGRTTGNPEMGGSCGNATEQTTRASARGSSHSSSNSRRRS